mmetsp:Transcript_21394/g.65298  ORF Transcript_21394/g.65298 Transcript_21394/m.65298 type:complete len:353 (-) Transcript_21394:303-1361(-)
MAAVLRQLLLRQAFPVRVRQVRAVAAALQRVEGEDARSVPLLEPPLAPAGEPRRIRLPVRAGVDELQGRDRVADEVDAVGGWLPQRPLVVVKEIFTDPHKLHLYGLRRRRQHLDVHGAIKGAGDRNLAEVREHFGAEVSLAAEEEVRGVLQQLARARHVPVPPVGSAKRLGGLLHRVSRRLSVSTLLLRLRFHEVSQRFGAVRSEVHVGAEVNAHVDVVEGALEIRRKLVQKLVLEGDSVRRHRRVICGQRVRLAQDCAVRVPRLPYGIPAEEEHPRGGLDGLPRPGCAMAAFGAAVRRGVFRVLKVFLLFLLDLLGAPVEDVDGVRRHGRKGRREGPRALHGVLRRQTTER